MVRLSLFLLTLISLTHPSCNQLNSEEEQIDPVYIHESEATSNDSDSTIDKAQNFSTKKKFVPHLSFAEFRSNLRQSGDPAEINFGHNQTAKQYKTIISEAYRKKTDLFAGNYVFVRWGCGTSCQQCAIIDLKDGEVYNGPPASLGYDYRADSRLLIVNPPDSAGFIADCSYCSPEFWIWEEGLKQFEKRD